MALLTLWTGTGPGHPGAPVQSSESTPKALQCHTCPLWPGNCPAGDPLIHGPQPTGAAGAGSWPWAAGKQGGDSPGTEGKPQSGLRGSCSTACLPLGPSELRRDKGPLCGWEAGAGLVPGLHQDQDPPASCAAEQSGVQEGTRDGANVRMGPYRAPFFWLIHSPPPAPSPHPCRGPAAWGPQLPPGLQQRCLRLHCDPPLHTQYVASWALISSSPTSVLRTLAQTRKASIPPHPGPAASSGSLLPADPIHPCPLPHCCPQGGSMGDHSPGDRFLGQASGRCSQ